MNSQASLSDQLNELEVLAVKNGLYDAHDWIRRVREQDFSWLADPRCPTCNGTGIQDPVSEAVCNCVPERIDPVKR